MPEPLFGVVQTFLSVGELELLFSFVTFPFVSFVLIV